MAGDLQLPPPLRTGRAGSVSAEHIRPAWTPRTPDNAMTLLLNAREIEQVLTTRDAVSR